MTLESKAIIVLRERLHIVDEAELIKRVIRLSDFTLAYLVAEARFSSEKAVLLNSKRTQINFNDIIYRVPFSEGSQLGYPDHKTLFKIFNEEYRSLVDLKDKLSPDPENSTHASNKKSLRRSYSDGEPPLSLLPREEQGRNQVFETIRRTLDECSILNKELKFNSMDPKDLYELIMGLQEQKLQAIELCESFADDAASFFYE